MRVRPLFRRMVPVAIGATAMTVMGFGAGALVSASESAPPLALCIDKGRGTVSAPESGECSPAATFVEVATQAGLDEALSALAAHEARLDTVESSVSGLDGRVAATESTNTAQGALLDKVSTVLHNLGAKITVTTRSLDGHGYAIDVSFYGLKAGSRLALNGEELFTGNSFGWQELSTVPDGWAGTYSRNVSCFAEHFQVRGVSAFDGGDVFSNITQDRPGC